jgi:hypothetical protein
MAVISGVRIGVPASPRSTVSLSAPASARQIVPANSLHASRQTSAPCVVRALSAAYVLVASSSGK